AVAIILAGLILSGAWHRAHEVAEALRNHVVHHWSIKVAELLLRSLTPHRLWWLVAAAAGDAMVSGIEGWAMARGYAWGAWMVVAATALLIPLEVIEIAHQITFGKVFLFVLNLVIVGYLVRRQLIEHHLLRARKALRS
ncbi:MAG TPA: DUF2127 domain-containing protein, partial [Polyangia bacterium]|nr:DUF2127 domain-containing protein [Polyangia bacterium]